MLRIPDVPGVGLEWDEDAVARYLRRCLGRTAPFHCIDQCAIATAV